MMPQGDAAGGYDGARTMPPTLLHVFPTLAIGGQQTRFATIANGLGREFRHRLISLDGRDEAVGLLDHDLDVAVLPAPPTAAHPIDHLHRIGTASARAGADILITYNWGAIEWAIANWTRPGQVRSGQMRLGRPHIHLEDGFGPDEADRQKRRRVVTRSLVLRRSAVVVPSRQLMDIAVRVWRLAPQRVHYIPNGIDPTRFDGIARGGAPFFQRRDDECIIGSFSPLRGEKNIGRLLRAFARIAPADLPARLVICGDGPEGAALRRLCGELQVADRVTFTGHVPRPEAVMGAFDIFAMTSDTEQMPYALLEAMAARLPILATDVGDIAAIVSAENRPYVVMRDDLDGLAGVLAALCRSAQLRRDLGECNRRRIERDFRIDPMVRDFRRIILAAVGKP
jgi:glycosyltransferase involved in cell wall biosynthesis